MRFFVMLLFLAIAVPCHAEDPLETLNTVEDTLSTMERTLKTRAGQKGDLASAAPWVASERLPLDDRLYFVSDEALGADDWVAVRPCTEELAMSQAVTDGQSCIAQADGSVAMGRHYWKSRPAAPGDLRIGAFVVARDQAADGEWYVTRITNLSDLQAGFVAVTAPFRAPLRGLRVVE